MAKLSFFGSGRGLNLILAIIFVLLVIDCLINPRGLRDLAILRQDQAQLTATRDQLLAEKSQHDEALALLRNDNTYLQRLIRQELGYVRPDELVYRFASPAANSEPKPSGAMANSGRRTTK